MKFPGEAAERVARTLLVRGPSTVAELAADLEMSPTAVRRPLTALAEAGLVLAHDRAPYGPSPRRGPGRPGGIYSLTPAGHAACDEAYDDLALGALRFMRDAYGPQSVTNFAAQRARQLGEAIGADPTPHTIAEALTAAGYAAEVKQLGDVADQLCQHHCPVVAAAREFPEICEAESAELSRLLGRHVTRLATLAQGDEVCTAVIPRDPGLKEPAHDHAHKPDSRKVSA